MTAIPKKPRVDYPVGTSTSADPQPFYKLFYPIAREHGPTAALVLGVYWFQPYVRKTGRGFPSNATIAQKAGLKLRSVERAVAKLKRAGLIQNTGRHSSNTAVRRFALDRLRGLDSKEFGTLPEAMLDGTWKPPALLVFSYYHSHHRQKGQPCEKGFHEVARVTGLDWRTVRAATVELEAGNAVRCHKPGGTAPWRVEVVLGLEGLEPKPWQGNGRRARGNGQARNGQEVTHRADPLALAQAKDYGWF